MTKHMVGSTGALADMDDGDDGGYIEAPDQRHRYLPTAADPFATTTAADAISTFESHVDIGSSAGVGRDAAPRDNSARPTP